MPIALGLDLSPWVHSDVHVPGQEVDGIVVDDGEAVDGRKDDGAGLNAEHAALHSAHWPQSLIGKGNAHALAS